MKARLIILFLFITGIVVAQCDIDNKQGSALNPPQSPPPPPQQAPAVPYQFVREADVIWSKRIWRMLDLREKMNLKFYYPVTPNADRKSMWDVIYCAVLSHEITIYAVSPFDYDKSFVIPMTRTEADTALMKIITVIDSNGNSSSQGQHLESPDLVSYMLKEDWFFDKQRSVLDVRILGICPFKKQFDQNGNEVPGGSNMMFWIYYPEIRSVFAKAQVFNPNNNFDRRSLESIFMKRMFSSYIVEESNVYNRRIGDYIKNTLDALLEGEAIKNKIFNLEHDMWQY